MTDSLEGFLNRWQGADRRELREHQRWAADKLHLWNLEFIAHLTEHTLRDKGAWPQTTIVCNARTFGGTCQFIEEQREEYRQQIMLVEQVVWLLGPDGMVPSPKAEQEPSPTDGAS